MREARITQNLKERFRLFAPKNCPFETPEDEARHARKCIKTCSKCHVTKTRVQFRYNTSGKYPFDKDGNLLRRPECIECARKILKTKKVAIDRYTKTHGHRPTSPVSANCQLCHENVDKLVFDHGHATCEYRGWICNRCNQTLGQVEKIGFDNIQKYLNQGIIIIDL